MALDLTGQKVSFTYGRLIQLVDGIYYSGLGDPVNLTDSSSLIDALANYISDASLNADTFYYDSSGYLDVSISGAGVSQNYIDGSLNNIRATYIPDVSLSADFLWSGGLLYIDASLGGSAVSKIYVDASLIARDISINYLYEYNTVQDGSILNLYSQIGVVDPSLDYNTYQPIPGDISVNYTGDLVTSIVTTNFIGTKTVDFVYDINNDVSIININNYGVASRAITFEKDLNDNIIAVHINE